jgi:hypothetical protein
LVRHSRAVNQQIQKSCFAVTYSPGHDLYLGNYTDAQKALPALIDETVRLLDRDQRHEERLADLRHVVNGEGARAALHNRRAAGRHPDAARAIVTSDLMNQIRQLLSEIKNEEDQILSSCQSALQKLSTLLQADAAIPLLLIGAIGVLTRQYMRRSLSALTVALREREESQFCLQLAIDAAHLGRGSTIRFTALGAQSDGRRLFLAVARDVTDRRAYQERIAADA